jgi:hypothetical protein
MLNALKDVQSDDSVVGFYIATPFNAFFTQSMLEMQSAHQARLRQGGIVVVHGQWVRPPRPAPSSRPPFRLDPGTARDRVVPRVPADPVVQRGAQKGRVWLFQVRSRLSYVGRASG